MKQSRYLCSKIPNNEWVGAVIYEFTGNWVDETLEITVLDIFPMYEANGMSFDGEFNFDYNYAIDKGYDIEKFRIGLIHSHCQSGVFFSGPDMEELKSTSKIHPFYLSLITNNNNDWTGKVCVYSKKTYDNIGVYETKNIWGDKIKKEFKETKTEDAYNIFDVKVFIYAENIDDEAFKNRVDAIIKEKQERNTKVVNNYKYNYDYNHGYGYNYNQIKDDDLDFIILSFFEDTDVDYKFVFNFGEYSIEYSPENLVRYVRSFAKEGLTTSHIINKTIKLTSGFNTAFTKELVKDYKSFINKQNYIK